MCVNPVELRMRVYIYKCSRHTLTSLLWDSSSTFIHLVPGASFYQPSLHIVRMSHRFQCYWSRSRHQTPAEPSRVPFLTILKGAQEIPTLIWAAERRYKHLGHIDQGADKIAQRDRRKEREAERLEENVGGELGALERFPVTILLLAYCECSYVLLNFPQTPQGSRGFPVSIS